MKKKIYYLFYGVDKKDEKKLFKKSEAERDRWSS